MAASLLPRAIHRYHARTIIGRPWSDLTPPSATWLAAPRRAGRRPVLPQPHPWPGPFARPGHLRGCARGRVRWSPLPPTTTCHAMPQEMEAGAEQSRGWILPQKGHRMEIRIRNIPQTSFIQSNPTKRFECPLEQVFFFGKCTHGAATATTKQLSRRRVGVAFEI